LKLLDSGLSALSSRPKGFRLNDGKGHFPTFYECIKSCNPKFIPYWIILKDEHLFQSLLSKNNLALMPLNPLPFILFHRARYLIKTIFSP
jgi:hypothetical protein